MHHSLAPFGLFLIADAAVIGAPTGEWWQPLVQAGALGVILLWFMLRVERKLEDNTRANLTVARAIERNNKSLMVVILAVKSLDKSAIHDLARQLIAEADQETEQNNEGSNRRG